MMVNMVMEIFLIIAFCALCGALVVALTAMLWAWIKHIIKLNK